MYLFELVILHPFVVTCLLLDFYLQFVYNVPPPQKDLFVLPAGLKYNH